VKESLKEDYASLVRYFLGELWDDEQERVEERYVLHEAFSELRDEVELDLVDAYVAGTLTPQQRQHFEENYLVSPSRKKAVELAWLSRAYRERIALRGERPARNLWGRLRQWLSSGGRLAPALVAGAALAAAGAGGSWIVKKLSEGRISRPVANQVTEAKPAVEKPPDAVPAIQPDEARTATKASPAPVAAPSNSRAAGDHKVRVNSSGSAEAPASPIPPAEPVAAPVAAPPVAVAPPLPSPVRVGPVMPKAQASMSVTVPFGAEVAIRTADAIDSRIAGSPREFAATLDSALVQDGITIAPAGASAVLRIIEAGQKRNVSLYLRLTSITVNGQSVAVETGDVASATTSTSGGTVVFRGKDVLIPSATRLTFNLAQPVVVKIPNIP
jgi:hypothetical protein